MYLIKVEGEIKVISGSHYIQEASSRSYGGEPNNGDYYFDWGKRIVYGDLILTNKKKAIPYAGYYTDKGICVYEGAQLYAASKYYAAFYYYRDNIAYIRSILNKKIDSEDLEELICKSLFIDLWSALELLLCDLLMCMIYIYDDVHCIATDYYVRKIASPDKAKTEDIDDAEREYFFDKIVYHRFSEVGKMYKEILGIKFPKFNGVRSYIHKRHNIVHRHSLSNLDRMSITVVSREDVEGFMNEVENFVNELKSRIDQKYKDRK